MSALQTFRHYRISQDPKGGAVELWRSGSEVVCLAVDMLRQVFVELHVCVPPADKARETRAFQQISGQASQARHRHLLSVLDCGEDEGANYYVTEFVDGERLDTYLARCGPIPSWLALQWLSQLAEGLAALANQPRLLAGVNLFNSSVQMLGEAPRDFHTKVADWNLGEETPKAMQQGPAAEQAAISALGHLFAYMLTGSTQVGGLDPADLSQLPPEFTFMIGALVDPSHQHHPANLEQTKAFLGRCLQDLSELAAPPEKLPASLRPRLPLQHHFIQPAALAEYLSEEFQIDPQPFDSLHPYRHLATARATRTPAVIQLLPPDRLIPKEYLRPLRQALQRINGLDHAHLLRVVAFWENENSEFFIEEATPKLTLEHLIQLKKSLSPMETVVVLEHLLEASRQADACGLSPVIRCPQELFIQFLPVNGETRVPSDAEMLQTPLQDWPAFRIRVRTYPIALNLTQPERFSAEKLLPAAYQGQESTPQKQSSLITPPTARDFALLAHAMCGGHAQCGEKVRHLIYDYLGNRKATQGGPKEFVERLSTTAGRSIQKPPPTKKTVRKKKTDPPPTTVEEVAPTFAAEPIAEPVERTSPIFGHAPIPPPRTLTKPGFAEALFGGQIPADDPPPAAPLASGGSPFATPPVSPFGPPPDGRNFLDGPGFDEQASLDEDFYLADEPRKPSLLLVLLLVILIAALVAGVLAHFTGMGFWVKK